MTNRVISVSRLHLAQIRYFDGKGSEIPDFKAYAFLEKYGDDYYNIFNLSMDFPVLDRAPYYNYTLGGEAYGNKLFVVSKNKEVGPCYILEKNNMTDVLGDSISLLNLTEYVINSKLFFVDRVNILKERGGITNKLKLYSDLKKLDKVNSYFESKDNGKKLIK